MTETQLAVFNESVFEIKDWLVNLTKICKANGKRLDVWLKSAQTKAYLKALEAITPNGGIQTIRWNTEQWTFASREVAIKLSWRISPEFEVFCTMKLRELFETWTTTIQKALPVTARELALAYGKLAETEEKLALAEKKVTDLFESDWTYTSKELASHLNLTIRQFNQYLIDIWVCMFTKKGYILTPAYLNKGMAEVKLEEVNPWVYRNIFYWTEYGRFTIIELQRLYDLSLSS